ncbi:MAG: hypothetical protein LBK03_05240 [Bacteroidales bacterium]|jgi:3-oxoacyl-(acyl-carrier-protein) synthase|nr:hypothetical protein [Bacteroidales bacterium]
MKIKHTCTIKEGKIIRNGQIVLALDIQMPAVEFLPAAYRAMKLDYPKFFKMDNLCKLAFLAAEVLLQDTPIVQNERNEETGLILFNSVSSLDNDEKFQASMAGFPSPSLFVYTLPNLMIGELCIRYKIYGENILFVSENHNFEQIMEQVKIVADETAMRYFICGYVDFYKENYDASLRFIEVNK